MAGTTGLSTTFDLPNYTGDLYLKTPTMVPFLSMAGGLSGGRQTSSVEFEWTTEDLRDPVANNAVKEGQAAPTADARVRANVTNVVEIHQEALNLSYTLLGARGQKNGVNNDLPNNVPDEYTHQARLKTFEVARDVNASFLTGVYNKPSDNSDVRKTRGIITAISSNIVNAAVNQGNDVVSATTSASAGTFTTSSAHGLSVGDQILLTSVTTTTGITADRVYWIQNVGSTTTFKVAATKGGSAVTLTGDGSASYVECVDVAQDDVGQLMQTIATNGGFDDLGTVTLFANSRQKRMLSKAFITDGGFRQADRNVGGVNCQTIVNDFGTLNVVFERAMPAHKILVAQMSQVAPVFLEIPGKGHFFWEPLGKTGATVQSQMYGEIGLQYGNEAQHGVLTGLKVG